PEGRPRHQRRPGPGRPAAARGNTPVRPCGPGRGRTPVPAAGGEAARVGRPGADRLGRFLAAARGGAGCPRARSHVDCWKFDQPHHRPRATTMPKVLIAPAPLSNIEGPFLDPLRGPGFEIVYPATA